MNNLEKIIIVACTEDGVIGKDGNIPWHYPEDLKYFKKKTTGHPVVMGRKTFESLPEDYTPLPNRVNIVLTSSPDKVDYSNVEIAGSLEEAWDIASQRDEKVFIAGGSSVYGQTIDEADRMLITLVKEDFEGDSYFPDFKKESWDEQVLEETDKLIFKEFSKP